MTPRSTLLRRLRGDESGFGMVLVLGMAGILSALMVVTIVSAQRSLESSRKHVSFESALAAAEGGVDIVLARAQRTYEVTGADTYVTPDGGAACPVATVVWPAAWATTQPTVEQERTWARQQLETIGANAACRRTTRAGDFVMMKPQGRQTVYALGWSPAYGAPEVKRRLIKAEYLFTPYRPTHAILTGGSLLINSSTTVTSAPPNSPTLAAVHTNGSLTVSSGNPTVYGPVTQTAANPTAQSNNFNSNTGGTVIGKARQTIPFLGARAVWQRNRASVPPVPGGWYDLCPDGTVKAPSGANPCEGTLLADVSTGGSFRGWEYVAPATPGGVPTWRATSQIKQNGFSGTYFVHQGDVLDVASNSGASVPNLTVIASSRNPWDEPADCNKVGGNISWGSVDPAAPSVPNTFLIADQDLKTSSNYKAGSASGGTVVSGLFIAGDQIEMQTSSAGAYGAVVAADQCDPPNGQSLVDFNEIKNPSIYYDPNGQAPFIDTVNTTLWLEYPG